MAWFVICKHSTVCIELQRVFRWLEILKPSVFIGNPVLNITTLLEVCCVRTIQLFADAFEPALNHMVGKASYGEFTHRESKSPTPITDATWARHNCKEMWAFGRERRPTGNWHTARTIVLFLLPSGLHMKHVRLMTLFWFFGVFLLAWVIFAQYMSMVLR